MSSELYTVLIFGCIAVGLLIADRVYRINPYLRNKEGFQSGGAYRCGVDLPPCAFPLRCINGICGDPVQRQLSDRNPLPVLPQLPSLLPGVSDMATASTLPAAWSIQLPPRTKYSVPLEI